MAQAQKFNPVLLTAFFEALKVRGMLTKDGNKAEQLKDFEKIAVETVTISEINAIIDKKPARSAWAKGVKFYAEWIFEEQVDKLQGGYITLSWLLNSTEKDLLNGAKDWKQASWGGCFEIYNGEIAENLCAPSELKRTKGGELPPNSREEWLDVQARALFQASNLVLEAIADYRNKRGF